jgi:hypothetical protein
MIYRRWGNEKAYQREEAGRVKAAQVRNVAARTSAVLFVFGAFDANSWCLLKQQQPPRNGIASRQLKAKYFRKSLKVY